MTDAEREREIERLKARLAELNEDGTETGQESLRQMGERARDKASEALDSMRESWDTAARRGKETWDTKSKEIEGYAKENPWKALAIAGLVGFVVAKMTEHRRR